MKKILALMTIMVLGVVSIVATSSTNLDIDSFEVYIGDVNGDGNEDLYLASIPKFVLIAMEIIIPLTVVDAQPVLLKGNGDGTFQAPVAWDAEVNLGTMSVADYTIHTGDFNGDGIQDLFFQSNSISYQSIILNGANGDTALTAQTFSQLEGKDVSADYSSVRIEDVNGDGKDDIILDYGQSSETIALALATNRFNTVSYDDDSYQATYVPGSTSGQFNVSKGSGSASYAIPLALPVGTAGVQPSISIAYDSSASNGLMGVGFSLSGQSSVERCQKNRSIDGQVEVINLTSFEAFCLDGNRMLAVDGSTGREFRLVQDSFAKITSHGGTAAAPDYFKVQYKSGDISYYGSSEQAKLTIKGVNSTWAMTSTQDRIGNIISFSYVNNSNNVIIPNYIVYANNRIDFEYVDRADTIKSYSNGNKHIINQRLKKIDVSVGNHQFRSYLLGYDLNNMTEHSRLTSITECGADGTCLKPTTFTWSEIPTNPELGIKPSSEAHDLKLCADGGSDDCEEEKPSFADVNGDGVMDLCYRDKMEGILCHINDGYGEFSSIFKPTNHRLCADSGSLNYGCDDADNFSSIAYRDFNLDGTADIAFRSDDGVVLYRSLGAINPISGLGFLNTPLNISGVCGNSTGDAGCDGTDNYSTVKYPDVNGDSIPDICYRSDNGIACALSTGIDTDKSAPTYADVVNMTNVCDNGHFDAAACQKGKFAFMDFNGDGMADLVYRSKYLGVVVHYSTGSSFESNGTITYKVQTTKVPANLTQDKPSLITYICGSENQNGNGGTSLTRECNDENNHELIYYPDLNGDGNIDICWREDTGIHCVLGTGDDTSTDTAFTSIISTELCKDNGDANIGCKQTLEGGHYTGLGIQFADFNKDGKSDLFYRSRNGLRLHLFDGEKFSATADWSSSLCKEGSTDGCDDLDNFNTISLLDIDVDGLPDLVYRDDVHGFRVLKNEMANSNPALNNMPVLADVVTKIETGMGLSTEIEYARFNAETVDESCTLVSCMPTYIISATSSTKVQYPNVALASLPMPLVKQVQTSASDGGLSGVRYRYDSYVSHVDGFASPSFKKVWEYKYSARDSFGQVDFDASEPDTYVKHDYYVNTIYSEEVDEYISGRLYETTSKLYKWSSDGEDKKTNPVNDLGGRTLSSTKFTYEHSNSHVGDERIQFVRVKNKLITDWPRFTSSDTELYRIETSEDYTYGDYGNVAVMDKSVNKTTWQLENFDINAGVLAPVKQVTTTSLYEDEREEDWIIGLITKATVTKTIPNTLPGSTGNDVSTKISSWKYNSLGQVQWELVEPGSSDQVQTVYTYHDVFGLKETARIQANGVPTVTSTFAYDAYGKYVTSTTMSNSENAKTYTTSTSYDPVLGLQTSKTNANGLTSFKEHDGFGRTISQTDPFGVTTAINYSFSSDAYYTTTANNLGAASSTYYNAAGNVLQTRGLSLTGKVVYKDYSYFSDGATQSESLPYFYGDAVNHTKVIARDDQFRPTQTQTPAGDVESVSYNSFSSTYTNSLLQNKTIHKNALGQTIGSEDHLGNEVKFYFNADGHMISTQAIVDGEVASVISTGYDRMGRRTSISDPDKGDWTFTYNPLGKLITQTNAKGQTTCFAYDELGRTVKRIDDYYASPSTALNDCFGHPEPVGTTVWTYDTAPMGSTGKLVQGALHTIDGADGYDETYSYDNYGRVISVKRKIGGVEYVESNTYDNYGRALTHTYPNGLTTKNIYNSRGMLVQVVNNSTGYSYWQAQDADALGNITQELLGANITQTRGYDQAKGTIDWVRGMTPGGVVQHSMDFEFNSLGNLTYREDNLQGTDGFVETFTYDDLNRVTTNRFFNHGNRHGVYTSIENYAYQANGNIQSKAGVGSYNYDGNRNAGPHAVDSTLLNGVTTNYGYDLNGNMTTDGDRTIVYTTFDKPSFIVRSNGAKIRFKYGVGRNRIEREDTDAEGKVTETVYAAPGYEIVTTRAADYSVEKTEIKQYLPGGALIIDKTENSVNTSLTRFMLSDHIGSTTTILDGSGAAVQRFSYDAWGKRRNVDWTQVWSADALAALKGIDTHRGFTGHEMLDSVGIIHMNGRIYDPVLGRFMNADPVVQAPSNLQSLNRYSYVLNNPLTLTDPSGHISLRKFGRWLDKNVLKYVDPVSYYMYKVQADEIMHHARSNPEMAGLIGNAACGAATAGVGAIACAGLVGAVVTYSVTGDFDMAMRAGATAAATAAIWQGVGDGLDTSWGSSIGKVGRTMVHGTVGGLLSVAQGGKFGHGFAAAAASKGLNESGIGVGEGAGSPSDYFKNAAEAAFVGGTASVFAGGSFANGAKSAAFARLFNDMGHIREASMDSTGGGENSCQGTLICKVPEDGFGGSGRGSRDGIFGEEIVKWGPVDCRCDATNDRYSFVAPGASYDDLKGVTTLHSPYQQFSESFSVNTNGRFDQWRYKTFIEAFKSDYQNVPAHRKYKYK